MIYSRIDIATSPIMLQLTANFLVFFILVCTTINDNAVVLSFGHPSLPAKGLRTTRHRSIPELNEENARSTKETHFQNPILFLTNALADRSRLSKVTVLDTSTWVPPADPVLPAIPPEEVSIDWMDWYESDDNVDILKLLVDTFGHLDSKASFSAKGRSLAKKRHKATKKDKNSLEAPDDGDGRGQEGGGDGNKETTFETISPTNEPEIDDASDIALLSDSDENENGGDVEHDEQIDETLAPDDETVDNGTNEESGSDGAAGPEGGGDGNDAETIAPTNDPERDNTNDVTVLSDIDESENEGGAENDDQVEGTLVPSSASIDDETVDNGTDEDSISDDASPDEMGEDSDNGGQDDGVNGDENTDDATATDGQNDDSSDTGRNTDAPSSVDDGEDNQDDDSGSENDVNQIGIDQNGNTDNQEGDNENTDDNPNDLSDNQNGEGEDGVEDNGKEDSPNDATTAPINSPTTPMKSPQPPTGESPNQPSAVEPTRFLPVPTPRPPTDKVTEPVPDENSDNQNDDKETAENEDVNQKDEDPNEEPSQSPATEQDDSSLATPVPETTISAGNETFTALPPTAAPTQKEFLIQILASSSPTVSLAPSSTSPSRQQNPTASPTTQLSIPLPMFRYVEWMVLSSETQMLAGLLGYTSDLWNVLGTASVESMSFNVIKESDEPERLDYISTLGFSKPSWDCYINHYRNFSWQGLHTAGVQSYYATLGWTEALWNGTIPPTSESTIWDGLTRDEIVAAESLCYLEPTWNRESLENLAAWGVSTEERSIAAQLDFASLTTLAILLFSMLFS